MPVLTVRNTVIPYELARSQRAQEIRITVRPGRVSVTAPWFMLRRTIVAFVESKRDWIYAKTVTLRERELPTTPPRFVSGAKVFFRGRSLKLWVEEATESSLRFANAFHVTVEAGLTPDQREKRVRRLVMAWLEKRAFDDARSWTRKYGAELGAYPTRIRIGNQRSLWGSCSARGVVSLNWRLVAVPKPVFEYVVVHELCHLIERNHGPRFWSLVGSLLPDYRERRAWLKKRGVGLG